MPVHRDICASELDDALTKITRDGERVVSVNRTGEFCTIGDQSEPAYEVITMVAPTTEVRGWLSVNDMRAKEGMPPLGERGDRSIPEPSGPNPGIPESGWLR